MLLTYDLGTEVLGHTVKPASGLTSRQNATDNNRLAGAPQRKSQQGFG
jgi:hypothetical protein